MLQKDPRGAPSSLSNLCTDSCGFIFFSLESKCALGPGAWKELLGRRCSLSEPSRRTHLPSAQTSPAFSGSQVPGFSEARLGSGCGPGSAQALCLALAGWA